MSWKQDNFVKQKLQQQLSYGHSNFETALIYSTSLRDITSDTSSIHVSWKLDSRNSHGKVFKAICSQHFYENMQARDS